jgi:hypothetical protein
VREKQTSRFGTHPRLRVFVLRTRTADVPYVWSRINYYGSMTDVYASTPVRSWCGMSEKEDIPPTKKKEECHYQEQILSRYSSEHRGWAVAIGQEHANDDSKKCAQDLLHSSLAYCSQLANSCVQDSENGSRPVEPLPESDMHTLYTTAAESWSCPS